MIFKIIVNSNIIFFLLLSYSGAGCYVYEHAETGKIQWEYPGNEAPPPPTTPPPTKPPVPPSPPPNEPTDMDISTTPPPQSHHEARSHM